MREENWHVFADPETGRDRAGLEMLKEQLPGYEPFAAWVNFRFLPLEGGFFDVDLLVCSRAGVFLVELAPLGGYLHLRPRIWEQLKQNGEVEVFDNPLRGAQTKARELQSLVEKELPASAHAPPIEPVVFLSHPDVEIDAAPDALDNVAFHPALGRAPTIFDALVEADGPGIVGTNHDVTPLVRDRLGEVLSPDELDPSKKYVRIKDWELGELIDTAPRYQDFRAKHVSRDEIRRARVFRLPRGASEDRLDRLQEAERREYDLIQDLDHPGVLQATDHVGHEIRPTIFYEYPEGAERLDHVISSDETLTVRERFDLIGELAETIRYAHGQRIVHRALSPQSVLVVGDEQRKMDDGPATRILNWHTGRREDQETGTRHIQDYLQDPSKFFLAPEIGHVTDTDIDETADIFGLGALAYFLFTGEAPARSPQEFVQRITARGGLRISAVDDSVSRELDDLVFEATRVAPSERLATVEMFLERLEAARLEVLGTSQHGPSDPLEASPGDILEKRWEVRRRIGSGSTSTALLALEPDGRAVVLKVANDDAHAARLDAEAEALAQLDDPLIVDLHDRTQIGGRRTLVLQHAGNTLRQELRDRSALSLDEHRRFGEDLCHILRALESAGVYHRDIKPANIGLTQAETNRGPYRLLLFDFSLHGIGLNSIEVGTNAYRDPFLQAQSRGRWDDAADRYSAALVLYEMVTQRLPTWGDGRTNPAFDNDAQLHLDAERFPAAVRDDLQAFFERALAREVVDRFDTADDMLAAWREVFERTIHTELGDDPSTLTEARPETPLHTLGVSDAARDVLEEIGASTIRDLLERSSQAYKFKKGAGGEVREELDALRIRLSEIFPHLDAYGRDAPDDRGKPEDFKRYSVDDILDTLRRKPANFDYKGSFSKLIADVLQDDDREASLPWAGSAELAARVGLDPSEFTRLFEALRDAWGRKDALSTLRDDLVRIVDAAGGAMIDVEAARTVLWERGSLRDDKRIAAASAITRAALEAELAAEDSRLHVLRLTPSQGSSTANDPSSQGRPALDPTVFIATNPDLLDILPDLGDFADSLAAEAPLASSERVYRELADTLRKAGLDPLPRHRLLSLAAAASDNAAVSLRDELYPVGMAAARALKLTGNLLRRRSPIEAEEIARIVENHYPEAAPVPEESPELDETLRDADVGLVLQTDVDRGRGAYVPEGKISSASPAMTRGTALSSGGSSYHEMTAPERAERRDDFRRRAELKSRDGGFFVVTVSPHAVAPAREFLLDRYDLTAVSIDGVFLDVMRQKTDARGIDWRFFLGVDAPEAGERDKRLLGDFLHSEVIDEVQERLLAAGDRILYTNPGLLGRWDDLAGTMQIAEALRSRTRHDGPDVAWLLVPSDKQQNRPRVAGVAIPVDKGDYARIPRDLVKQPNEKQPASG